LWGNENQETQLERKGNMKKSIAALIIAAAMIITPGSAKAASVFGLTQYLRVNAVPANALNRIFYHWNNTPWQATPLHAGSWIFIYNNYSNNRLSALLYSYDIGAFTGYMQVYNEIP
jgi:hypothetical protein